MVVAHRRLKSGLQASKRVELVNMRMKGLTYSAIARYIGISPSTVRKWVKRWKDEGHINDGTYMRTFRRIASHKAILGEQRSSSYRNFLMQGIWNYNVYQEHVLWKHASLCSCSNMYPNSCFNLYSNLSSPTQ